MKGSMAFQKYTPPCGVFSVSTKSLGFSNKGNEKVQLLNTERFSSGNDVEVDLREVYFLIMHFLSAGPCQRTYGQLWNELLEHQLLPRRFHAWYSRTGACSGDENDDGLSFPLSYNKLVERYPHVEKDHLVKLLNQLIRNAATPSRGFVGRGLYTAAAVPTLLGMGFFSLLDYAQNEENSTAKPPPAYLRWPHLKADQVRGLSMREIGGGFTRHHRAPSIRAACYTIVKPSTMVQKMQNRKTLRGHLNSVYCAIFDKSGRYVITGSDDRLVKIWSMETAYCLASCRGHEGDITDLAVSSNNALVASASNDCVIRVWRLPDGLPISVLRGHTGAVTAIAFSPRPSSVYQLLSSSDDGTCRIWDARYSHFTPRIYIPKPPDPIAGKNGASSSNSSQQSHQIFCCAFNANGTVFVTGSSDNLARVWSAYKLNSDDMEPNHEIDTLAGHENDVNYVQFSGCAVSSKFSMPDSPKEENLPKFKNTWYNHDNIVTCSRDGSAIIWIPRSRRSHGKVGRWTRAYHLKVPPPPMPPQPPRGPRQRILPTPRGVNMIIWSLDNRFVLAAIMDCRICVWNAVDGSLVHSLTGHTDSTYVLDVHPFNPRMAMSAGYDGKMIVWDIWEGKPIYTYDIAVDRFKLVDGKFSPDGTSIILSDNVGQLYIINTGQGDSQTDAKYDQFFLGDYRSLVQDEHGNALDQETQLVPYRRNMQDLLCDSSMIPYPEPYQSMYQQRRLGALGIEWRPSSVRFAVGPNNTLDPNYQLLPIPDLELFVDTLPEFVDAMDWEPEIEVRSDDADSEYNVTEDYSSGHDRGSLGSNSSGDPEHSSESTDECAENNAIRRSKRKKLKAEGEVMTSSGRRVKRKNLDEFDGESLRSNRLRKSRHGHKHSRKKSSLSKSLRPQRAAARNALNFFSRISGTPLDEEDEEESLRDSSESDSTSLDSDIGSEESNKSLDKNQKDSLKGKGVLADDSEDVENPDEYFGSQTNSGKRKRLILKFPIRKLNKSALAENIEPKNDQKPDLEDSLSKSPQAHEHNQNSSHDINCSFDDGTSEKLALAKFDNHLDLPDGDGQKIKWGGFKARTPKNLKRSKYAGSSSGLQNCVEGTSTSPVPDTNGIKNHLEWEDPVPISTRLKIRSSNILKDNESHEDTDRICEEDCGHFRSSKMKEKLNPGIPNCEGSSGPCSDNVEHKGLLNSEAKVDKKYNFVYSRLRSSRSKRNPQSNGEGLDTNFLETSNRSADVMYLPETSNGAHRTRPVSFRGPTYFEDGEGCSMKSSDENDALVDLSDGVQKSSVDLSMGVQKSPRKSYNENPSEGISGLRVNCGLRSTRNRRSSYHVHDTVLPARRTAHQQGKSSWLLSTHEEGSRYIPQLGDDVAFLRQGHQEYLSHVQSNEPGPWEKFRDNMRAVEFCTVKDLVYSSLSGSGESCCKMTLELIDSSSSIVGKSFALTLSELVDFPDFIVEKSRYDAAIQRKWTVRDKCQVWWKNPSGDDGSWWEGRIKHVEPKSKRFPDSPWESFVIQYKSDPTESHLHSPWELHDADAHWEPPHIDFVCRDKLISALAKLEKSGEKSQDRYGIGKLKQVSQRTKFINRFPVPITLEVIQSRLENNYYRSLEAVKHDISVLLSNAESFFERDVELSSKLDRLSEWFRRTLSSSV